MRFIYSLGPESLHFDRIFKKMFREKNDSNTGQTLVFATVNVLFHRVKVTLNIMYAQYSDL